MNLCQNRLPLPATRRAMLQQAGAGFGALALNAMLTGNCAAGSKPAPTTARAKRVIFVFMHGGPSTIDLFDPKPLLKRDSGKPLPFKGPRIVSSKTGNLLASPWKFSQHGECGAQVSELLPNIASIADELCFIHSMHGSNSRHGGALLELHTGSDTFTRPAMGAWLNYGLGSENDNLPMYVVMVSGGLVPGGGSALWGSGFLPSRYYGTELRSEGDPVLYLSDPPGMGRSGRRRILDAIRDLNEEQFRQAQDPEIQSRISQYELAYRMQASVPELTDFSKESQSTLDAYGAKPGDGTFASNCLLARRLVERGVRFVELFDSDWDHHTLLYHKLPKKCRDVDQPVAALISDLAERGLLEETIVVFAGEFGRTAMAQTDIGDGKIVDPGRDHHRDAFTVLIAGGGMKPGLVYGDTDDFGYHITENPVHVHDLQATLLHLLGMDHERLTYLFMGREFRLTDVAGEVVPALMS